MDRSRRHNRDQAAGLIGDVGVVGNDLAREEATSGSTGVPGQTCRVVVSAPFLTYINESAV